MPEFHSVFISTLLACSPFPFFRFLIFFVFLEGGRRATLFIPTGEKQKGPKPFSQLAAQGGPASRIRFAQGEDHCLTLLTFTSTRRSGAMQSIKAKRRLALLATPAVCCSQVACIFCWVSP